MSFFSSLLQTAAPFIPGVGGLIAGAVGGLLGGKSKQEKMAEQQTGLVGQQTEMAKQQAAMYRNIGAPMYQTALQGLMSSYGYRAPGQGVAGTSLGQPPTGLQPGGTWGYSAGLGQQMGAATDPFDKAKQHIMDLVASGQIPQSMAAAAIGRLETDRAAQMTNLTIESQRAGPQALLGALGPALGAGPTSADIAAGAATGAATAATGAYNVGQQYTAQDNATMAAIREIAASIAARKKTQVPGAGGESWTNVVAGGAGMPGATSVDPYAAIAAQWPALAPYLREKGMAPEAKALNVFGGGY